MFKAVCRFKVRSVTELEGGQHQVELETTCDDSLPEDTRFCKYTPAGRMALTLTNSNVVERITPGMKLLVTLELPDEPRNRAAEAAAKGVGVTTATR